MHNLGHRVGQKPPPPSHYIKGELITHHIQLKM